MAEAASPQQPGDGTPPVPPPLSRRSIAAGVAAYASVSLPWMWYSEYVVEEHIDDPFLSKLVGTTNEWLFVLTTAALLYVLLVRMARRQQELATREFEALHRERRTAAQLQALADGTPDAIFAKDLQGRYTMFNAAAEDIAGRPAAEVIGRDDHMLFPAERAAAYQANDAEVVAKGVVVTFEEDVATPQGERVYLTTKGPLRDPGGRTIGVFGIARNVTEARRLERERESAHRMLADVLGRVTDAFAALDAQQHFVYANAHAARLWGQPRADALLGRGLWEVVAEGDGALRAGYERALAQGEPAIVETVDVAGRRWLEYRIHPSPQGVSLYFADITPRREAQAALQQREEALRRSELRYRLAAAGGHVWDWDIASGAVAMTPAFWQRLGLASPPPERAAASLLGQMHPQDRHRWREMLGNHLARREPCDLEFRARHADGSWRWFHLQGQAVWDEEGRATYMAGTTFDITEQRNAQQALLASQLELSELSQRLLDQERRTTRHLAQALHDRLGQILGSARLQLDLALELAADNAGTVPRPLENASARIDDAIGEVRRTLVELRPPLLESQGLASSLDNELRGTPAASLGVAATLRAGDATQRWPEAVEYAAFMIAREAIANALRHAGATRLEVHLDGGPGHLELVVRDDGSGIEDSHRQGRPGHLGLVGMRERAVAIGAQLHVISGAQGGTEVRLRWAEAS